MHDLDRTLRSYEPETQEPEAFEPGELYQEIYGEDGSQGETSDAELNDLAAELLTVSDEAELDQFLGGLLKKAGRFAKRLAPILKPIAKKLLPIAGRAVGTFFGGPVGGAVGGKLGSFATRLFEVDMESLEPQEQEMEVARNFVRLATAAANHAAGAPASADPSQVIRTAMTAAARAHAPGLLRGAGAGIAAAGGVASAAQTGRWIRRNGRIVVLGI
ncbi:MAG TPA: hypothetical protein VF883_01650 [Thermoanaerobaculia bacterium]|jgi:hypothetical protein